MLRAGLLITSAWATLSLTSSLALADEPGRGDNDADARAAATEARMTTDERLQLLYSIMPIAYDGVPSPAPDYVTPGAGYVPGIPRLGIPDIMETDATLGITNPLGARTGDVATAFPSGLSLAATFDPAIAYQSGKTIGSEARSKGFNVLLSGGVNLTRDWFNGRNFEYLGEDPLLAGTMAGQSIKGTQSVGVVSTIKHLALNAQETQRNYIDAQLDDSSLRESDLLAFKFAIEIGDPGSVMCAYNKVNGSYACGSEYLLNDVLKRDWGFKGWVMSDWAATHELDYFNKGLDQQSGAQFDKQIWFGAPLRAAVDAGEISPDRVSDAARRILRGIYAAGADRPLEKTPIDYAAHAKVARDAAAQGITLLKNTGALPIRSDRKMSILLVGGYADRGVISGGGSSQVTPVGGDAGIVPVGAPGAYSAFARQVIVPSSPLDALRRQLPDAEIEYESGYYPGTAAAHARDVDLVIVFATKWQSESMDSPSLDLPNGQDELIDAIAAENPNVVVVLETGNPVVMPWLDKVAGVVEAWFPGQSGGDAIADVLTGAVNPSGHLPMTFPMNVQQSPRPRIEGLGKPDGTEISVTYSEGSDVGYRRYSLRPDKPLFSFGYGLSYTEFAHSSLSIRSAEDITARFTIANIGERAGADVAQLYLTKAAGKPVRRLVGFAKKFLEPGQDESVELTVDPRLLASWIDGRWHIASGQYAFALGHSADELSDPVEISLDAATFAAAKATSAN